MATLQLSLRKKNIPFLSAYPVIMLLSFIDNGEVVCHLPLVLSKTQNTKILEEPKNHKQPPTPQKNPQNKIFHKLHSKAGNRIVLLMR